MERQQRQKILTQSRNEKTDFEQKVTGATEIFVSSVSSRLKILRLGLSRMEKTDQRLESTVRCCLSPACASPHLSYTFASLREIFSVFVALVIFPYCEF